MWEGGIPPPVSTTYAKHYPIDNGNNSVPIQKVTKSKLMIDQLADSDTMIYADLSWSCSGQDFTFIVRWLLSFLFGKWCLLER